MLDTLKSTGKSIGLEFNRAWETISEGWSELLNRSSNALTQFTRPAEATKEDKGSMPSMLPRWSILAGEVEESDKDIVVRVELPGLDKDDCEIVIDGNMLRLSGSKQFERDTDRSTYHLMERAYGTFERNIMLPRNVDIDKAQAHFKNGVLTVRLPKLAVDVSKSIRIM